METHLLVPIQSHPLAFAIASGSILGAALLSVAFGTWQEYLGAVESKPLTPFVT